MKYIPVFRAAATFLLSSLWHGVEPGYFVTFLSFIPMRASVMKVSKVHLQACTFTQLN